MKRFFFFLLVCSFCVLKAQNVQLKVVISETGVLKNYEINVGKVNFIIDEYGNLLSFYPDQFEGDYQYYDDFSSARISGRIKQIGSLNIRYFDSFNDDKSGKPSMIGTVNVDYYSGQLSFKDGKLRTIDDVRIQYYDSEFADGRKFGRIKSFNNVKILFGGELFNTASENQVSMIGNSKIQYWEDAFDATKRGKLKSIKGNTPGLKIAVE